MKLIMYPFEYIYIGGYIVTIRTYILLNLIWQLSNIYFYFTCKTFFLIEGAHGSHLIWGSAMAIQKGQLDTFMRGIYDASTKHSLLFVGVP